MIEVEETHSKDRLTVEEDALSQSLNSCHDQPLDKMPILANSPSEQFHPQCRSPII